MYLEDLKRRIETERNKLVHHALYNSVKSLEQLRIFSSYHVFAVWDFMSLLKSLQQKLTCTTTPWLPTGNANTRYLINEIVLGEESDVDAAGNRISHFELYLQAMEEMGANTGSINKLVDQVRSGKTVDEAIALCGLPLAVQQFLGFTFRIVQTAPVHVQAAVFTFGREDLIPDMFIGLVKELSAEHGTGTATFRYYLERHIEVDGDHHSHLAMGMVSELCGNDAVKWTEATTASIEALRHRNALWSFVLEQTTAAELQPA